MVQSRHHLEAAVFQAGSIEVYQGGYQVVIGVWEISQVLVPLDCRAYPCGLHIELGVMEADIRPDRGFYSVENSSIGAEITKDLVAFKRVVDPPGDGFSFLRPRFEFQDRVSGGQTMISMAAIIAYYEA